MNKKILINRLDELVNNFIKNPFEEFTVINFLNENKDHLTRMKTRSETVKLADEIQNFGLKKKCLK